MEELDLKELFNMFWSRRLYIILITAIFVVIGVIYTYIFTEPIYQATTTIVLAQASNSKTSSTETESTITTNDLTLNQKLVSTYSELIKSKNVLGDVISNLNLNRTEDSLKGAVSVSSVKDTDLIQIAVRDEEPQVAQKVVSEIAEVFIDKVANGVYNINNVKVWDKAEVPTKPYNINHIKDILIFTAIGLAISAGYVLIANMLDTTIKSKEDVEKKVKLPVLTQIPLCQFEQKTKTSSKGGKK